MPLTDEQLEYVKARILRPAMATAMVIIGDGLSGKITDDEVAQYLKEAVDNYAPRVEELITGERFSDNDNRKA